MSFSLIWISTSCLLSLTLYLHFSGRKKPCLTLPSKGYALSSHSKENCVCSIPQSIFFHFPLNPLWMGINSEGMLSAMGMSSAYNEALSICSVLSTEQPLCFHSSSCHSVRTGGLISVILGIKMCRDHHGRSSPPCCWDRDWVAWICWGGQTGWPVRPRDSPDLCLQGWDYNVPSYVAFFVRRFAGPHSSSPSKSRYTYWDILAPLSPTSFMTWSRSLKACSSCGKLCLQKRQFIMPAVICHIGLCWYKDAKKKH